MSNSVLVARLSCQFLHIWLSVKDRSDQTQLLPYFHGCSQACNSWFEWPLTRGCKPSATGRPLACLAGCLHWCAADLAR